jgi:DNA-binding CsgD family transcriptional regulator
MGWSTEADILALPAGLCGVAGRPRAPQFVGMLRRDPHELICVPNPEPQLALKTPDRPLHERYMAGSMHTDRDPSTTENVLANSRRVDYDRAGRGMAPLWGRERELALIESFLESLDHGPALLVLEGEPGIGKTALWQGATTLAESRGKTVLTSRPAEPEASLAYSAVGDLLGGISDSAFRSLPGPQRQAVAVALLRADPLGRPADPRAVSMGTLLLLQSLATTPVLLAIDDWQWVDPASARVLMFAIRRLGGEKVGILLTVRQGKRIEVPGADLGWADDRRCQVAIGPVSVATLHRIVLERFDLALPRPLLVQLHQASGGNPFFALEIARAIVRSGKSPDHGDPLPVPDDLAQALTERLAALPTAARRALAVVAASGRPTRDLIRKAAGAAAAAKGLNAALQAGIAQLEPDGRLRFTHPLLGSMIGAMDWPLERRLLHRRLAELATGDEERAIHLTRGGATLADLPDIDAGARSAWLRGASDVAGELAEGGLALANSADGGERRRRRIQAAEYHFRAGEDQRATVLFEMVVAEAPPGNERARARWWLGWVLRHGASLAAAVAAFSEALKDADADVQSDVQLRATIERDLALTLINIGRLQDAHPHAIAAIRHAAAAGDRSLMNDAIGPLVLVEFLAGHGLRQDLVAQVRDDILSDHLPVALRTNVLVAIAQKWSDQFELARRRLLAEYRGAVERGAEADLPALLWSLSELECWAGNWTLAAEYAQSGVDTATLTGSPHDQALTLCARALIAACTGATEMAYADARAALRAAEASAMQPALVWSRHALGFLELSRGDAAAAHSWMAPLGGAVAAMGVGEPGSVRFVPDEIEALLGIGALEQATALLETFETRARKLNRTWALATGARCRGLLLAAKGDLDGAVRAVREALEHHENLAMPLELGRTLLQEGRIHRRRREKRAAKDALQAALKVFEQLGAQLWAARARSELERVGLRPPAGNDLTGTESAVARLAAQGRTNREIASAVFLSPKSVDGVILRIYAKLGIRSRAELGSRMSANKSQ